MDRDATFLSEVLDLPLNRKERAMAIIAFSHFRNIKDENVKNAKTDEERKEYTKQRDRLDEMILRLDKLDFDD